MTHHRVGYLCDYCFNIVSKVCAHDHCPRCCLMGRCLRCRCDELEASTSVTSATGADLERIAKNLGEKR